MGCKLCDLGLGSLKVLDRGMHGSQGVQVWAFLGFYCRV